LKAKMRRVSVIGSGYVGLPTAVVFASRSFSIAVWEPYMVTLARSGFIVDLYTHPSFAWVVYMDGERLLECCVEEIEVGNLGAKALSREVWGLAVDYGVEEALEELLRVCSLVRSGVEEAPCKLRPRAVLRAYVEKAMHDPSFRSTLPNILRYVITKRDIGEKIIARITRRSY